MKKTPTILTLLLIILAIYWSFRVLLPQYSPDDSISETEFSTDRALKHVKELSKEPHGVGFAGHSQVRAYISSELEQLGLETTLQEGYTAGDWGNLSKAENILARIKGSENGKALLLLSHYDSSPHSSMGASDAASGVATILEGIRAFLKTNKNPKNDIIIFISDAEELGLNGADLFVDQHEWLRDVGLVLNFEARGSGGPSYMLMETNRGNSRLISEFIKANPEFPVANSLAYSIYKMLPNDTDLTVFREDGDVEGFNFAFIDDHFDYHTANDNYERLDRNTLAHQGSYLMPLLHHFSTIDLNNLKSLNDNVYFNVPFFKMVSYPFEWIMPMLLLAIIFFIILLVSGFRKKVLNGKDVLKGFIPVIFSLIINGIVGYYSWSILKWLYPSYNDILHGFTYNGHAYIMAFALFSIGICFYAYHRFKVVKTANLLIAPLFLWLLLCGLLAIYLKGAAFFIVPVFSFLVGLYVHINQKNPNPFLLTFLGIPALFILSPFVKMFPVGLGLKMMIATTLLTTLIFFLLLPLFTKYRQKAALSFLSFILFAGFIVSAHTNSNFTNESPKPTSLLYVLNADDNTAVWATYEHEPSNWTTQFIPDKKDVDNTLTNTTISSKYASNFTYTNVAPIKKVATPNMETQLDTVIGTNRHLRICITPNRPINRLEVFTNEVDILKANVNGIELSEHFLKNRGNGKLITHYISDMDYTELNIEVPADGKLELTVYEASNDLLNNDLFTVPQRKENQIPMPFVLNDAILTIQKIKFE
ncbi:M28 family peptidase [Maribacter hydrothermalis]|uniref:Vacuolar membrane protease n=1 Tax=Maribacter hydrothermalis TaxID=1836467 RepID=A0A1B7ZEY2_9FLAO|nr:M28 family peptidase [Maribacter hydrothermalis]APQ17620.1 peptidase M28 [Maribacter hydrothermalis]OBR42094.1 peptidase M28 [Maribacter hydrothermalis]